MDVIEIGQEDGMSFCDLSRPRAPLEQELPRRGTLRENGRSGRRRRSRRNCLHTSRTAYRWIPLCALALLLQSTFGFHLGTRNFSPARTCPRRVISGMDVTFRQMTATVVEPEFEAAETPRRAPRAELDSSQPSSSAAFGQWEEVEGNFILRPSIEDGPPRALGTF